MFLDPRLDQLEIVIDPNIPLTRKVEDKDTGEVRDEDVLCWQIDGKLVVHPGRYEKYFKPLLALGGGV